MEGFYTVKYVESSFKQVDSTTSGFNDILNVHAYPIFVCIFSFSFLFTWFIPCNSNSNSKRDYYLFFSSFSFDRRLPILFPFIMLILSARYGTVLHSLKLVIKEWKETNRKYIKLTYMTGNIQAEEMKRERKKKQQQKTTCFICS